MKTAIVILGKPPADVVNRTSRLVTVRPTSPDRRALHRVQQGAGSHLQGRFAPGRHPYHRGL